MLERVFQLTQHRTTLRRELVAGLTTFAAMAYILAVNPGILGLTGMDRGALITATALASALMTALMALATNYPIALAPGMGLNAFFTFGLCLGAKVPWQAALGLVFYSGVIFLLLTLTGIRKKLIEAIPHELKLAITCGIGLFIAFIGLKGGGIIVASPPTFVSLGDLHQPGPLLVLGGIVLTAILVWRKIPGAIIIVIGLITALGFFLKTTGADGKVLPITAAPEAIVALPASLAPTFLKLDLGYFWSHWRECLPLLLALLFVDLFDNMGTLIGVCQRAGLLDQDGNLPKLGRALSADATAAMVGSTLGTSTVTSYIESAAGVEAGGRTGLTALTTAGCFLLALFLSPLIAIIPAVATAPALVIVGVFMMQSIAELDLKDFSKAVPAVVTMLAMPLTFSIAEGIALGFVVYVLFNLGTGRAKEVKPLAWVLAVLFLAHLIWK
ncbi:MAG TPA: NCS2 family permease [Candidatus Limnocylindria bacterium]|nr:NCS2 family permease [Candidatus Limnocylindria bacterium]